MAQVYSTNPVFIYMYIYIYTHTKLRCCSHSEHHTHSGSNPVTHIFLIQASTSHDSTVLHQINSFTQKSYGHEPTMHPEQTCYTWKKRGNYFTTNLRMQQNFHLPPRSPLPACFHQRPVSSLAPPRNRYLSNTLCNTINYLLVVKQTTGRLKPS